MSKKYHEKNGRKVSAMYSGKYQKTTMKKNGSTSRTTFWNGGKNSH
jgi:hypothetical protein